MIGRFAAFLDREDRFDSAMAGAEGNDDPVDALRRHEAGWNGNPDRQRAQHQQGK